MQASSRPALGHTRGILPLTAAAELSAIHLNSIAPHELRSDFGNVSKLPEPCAKLHSIPFTRQASHPVRYKSFVIGDSRLDFLVAERLIVELKSCQEVLPIHVAQVLSYLRVAESALGLLINFNVRILRNVNRQGASRRQKTRERNSSADSPRSPSCRFFWRLMAPWRFNILLDLGARANYRLAGRAFRAHHCLQRRDDRLKSAIDVCQLNFGGCPLACACVAA